MVAGPGLTENSTFVWRGVDRSGRRDAGEIAAANMQAARRQLLRHGIHRPIIREKRSARVAGGKLRGRDITLLLRQLKTLLTAGVPLVQAFDIVKSAATKARMVELLRGLRDSVATGNSLASALQEKSHYFNQITSNLIAIGEQSGTLEVILERLASHRERSENLKKQIQSAATYPIVVLIVAAIVVTILLIKVVPTFQEIFSGFGAELPVFTQWVIGLSAWMRDHWLQVMLLLPTGFYLGRTLYRRNTTLHNAVDRTILRLPIVGGLVHKTLMVSFARTMATMLEAGVPLLDALRLVMHVINNSHYRAAIDQIAASVATGQSLHLAMRNLDVFPPMSLHLIAIGEESGSLDSMLAKLADDYEQSVGAAIEALTSLLEPLIMIVLGVLIGGLVIAMYLPVFSMGQVLGAGP